MNIYYIGYLIYLLQHKYLSICIHINVHIYVCATCREYMHTQTSMYKLSKIQSKEW